MLTQLFCAAFSRFLHMHENSEYIIIYVVFSLLLKLRKLFKAKPAPHSKQMGRWGVIPVAVDVLCLFFGYGVAADGNPDGLLEYFVDVVDTIQGARLHIIVEPLFLNEFQDLLDWDLP